MQERDVWFDQGSHLWALWVDTSNINNNISQSERKEAQAPQDLKALLPTWLCAKLASPCTLVNSDPVTQPSTQGVSPTCWATHVKLAAEQARNTKPKEHNPRTRLLYAHTRGKAMTLNLVYMRGKQVSLLGKSRGSFLARTKDFAWLHDFARSSRVLCSAQVCFSKPPIIQDCKVVGWVVDYTLSHVELACNHMFFFVRVADVQDLGLAINDYVCFELRREENRFVPCNIARLVM